jgi:N-acetylglucosamine-6-sulfatase
VASPPNIVFILTDDMSRAELDSLPTIRRLLTEQGTTFRNYLVGVSLCCPSRASTLRGQYAHNTGVLSNAGPRGGFGAAVAGRVEQQTIATALSAAGYRTALIGKYLNGYPLSGAERYVPPGWSEWVSPAGGQPYTEFNYVLNQDGALVNHGASAEDYGTDVYLDQALRFIRGSAAAGAPFFLYLSVYAPHEPAVAAPRHAGRFLTARAPRTPSYNETDVSDKPGYIARARRMPPAVRRAVDRLFRRRLRSLLAVDEAVGAIVEALSVRGLLQHTYLVFASDNGFHLGQHRLPAGKRSPYEEDIRVPLIIRGPGVPAGQVVSALAANTDLAPTFAALAGTTLAYDPDGRSLLPLLFGPPPAQWRTAYLLDYWPDRGRPTPRPLPDRLEPGTLEPPDMDEVPLPGQPTPPEPGAHLGGLGRMPAMPGYHGIRTERYAYVEYDVGEQELYDLRGDPDELHNLIRSADPDLIHGLARRLAALRGCRGESCRLAEDGGVEGGAE